MENRKPRLAILDMNDDFPNQGLRCIQEIASRFDDVLDWEVFDVRFRNQIPDLSFDLYISSGGPGTPLENGEWREPYYELLDQLRAHNDSDAPRKKFVFFICYSFQLACEYFELGTVNRRKSTSFGVFPIHKTAAGKEEYILSGLNDPYYAVDSRDWQVVQPDLEVFANHGASILSLEKIRTHVEFERAIMAVRFSDEFIGTQFHPEADPEGMKSHFSIPFNREKVISNFDKKKYEDMMAQLDDPDKIKLTHSEILPRFITSSLKSINAKTMELKVS